nr:MAG TPA: hypothetical protein [Caudoviricetes sp.]
MPVRAGTNGSVSFKACSATTFSAYFTAFLNVLAGRVLMFTVQLHNVLL